MDSPRQLMPYLLIAISCFLLLANLSFAQSESTTVDTGPEWNTGMDIESFWQAYIQSRNSKTWSQSSQYPNYEKVREGDLFMVEVEQGICLMEFFHSRWRRANDVRRWDDSFNEYSGCPYVFD